MRALRAIEARIAEATAVLAQTDAAALLGAGAARSSRTVEAVKARLTVAAAIGAHAVARAAIPGAAAGNRAVGPRPLEVALTHAVDAHAVMMALIGARGQGHRAVEAAVALLAQALATQAQPVRRASMRALDWLLAGHALPARLTEAGAEPARAMAGAVGLTLEEGEGAVVAAVARLARTRAAEADAAVRALIDAAGHLGARLAAEAGVAPALAVHATATLHAVRVTAVARAGQCFVTRDASEARLTEALALEALAVAGAARVLVAPRARLGHLAPLARRAVQAVALGIDADAAP